MIAGNPYEIGPWWGCVVLVDVCGLLINVFKLTVWWTHPIPCRVNFLSFAQKLNHFQYVPLPPSIHLSPTCFHPPPGPPSVSPPPPPFLSCIIKYIYAETCSKIHSDRDITNILVLTNWIWKMYGWYKAKLGFLVKSKF